MRLFTVFIACVYLQVGQAQNRFSSDLVLKVIYQHQYDVNTEALLPYLTHAEVKYRLAACLAFASVQDTVAIPNLKEAAKNDLSLEVRKAAIYSLGQLRLNSISKYFISIYKDKTYRALQNDLLMAIGKGAKAEDTLFYDRIRIKGKDLASNYAYAYSVYQAYRRKPLSKGIQKNLERIKTKGNYSNLQTYSLEATILALYWGLVPKPEVKIPELNRMPEMRIHIDSRQIALQLQRDSNPYHLITYLKRGECTLALLESLAFSDSMPFVVRTHCMEQLLGNAAYTDTLNYKRLLSSGNGALVSMACEKIREDSSFKKQDKISLAYLEEMKKNLSMPKDFEVWVDIEKTQAWYLNKKYTYQSWFTTGYTNPIDWEYVKRIPEHQKVKITTNKGDIVLICKVNESPASVANFLKLVDSGYYKGKYFHRMVSNFVVQGGCPRGDGWGALDWVQRSEFSNYLQYKPGSVGLASAGKDSEGVQFFITHTFTPHLDGCYTIFAEVEQGMDVVQRLDVGDLILSVERL